MNSLSPSQIERVKLTASFLNIMAAGLMISGVIVPIVSAVYNAVDIPRWNIGMGVTIQLVLIFVSLGLHGIARHLLKELDQ